jgi:DNA-binding transcriptional LysR family regulator
MDLLDQMATFVRVVEAGSLAAASRALDRSVAALSRQLSALEEDLGASLIVRTTRRHHVTEAGQLWYQRCVRILEDIEAARRSVRPGAVQGRLTVSVPVSIGMHWVLPALGPLLGLHPRLKVEVHMEDRVVNLVSEGVDVVVRAGAPIAESSSLIAKPLASFRRIAVASPSWLKANGPPRHPSDLAARDCIVQLGGDGPLDRWTFHQRTEVRTCTVRSRLACTAPIAVRELVCSGYGVGWLPEWLVAEDLASGRLKPVLSGWTSAPLTVWAVFRVELRRAERVRAFVDAVQAAIASHAEQSTVD